MNCAAAARMPDWLIVLAWVWLGLGMLCALVVVLDLVRRPQHMWIMNLV